MGDNALNWFNNFYIIGDNKKWNIHINILIKTG